MVGYSGVALGPGEGIGTLAAQTMPPSPLSSISCAGQGGWCLVQAQERPQFGKGLWFINRERKIREQSFLLLAAPPL